MEIGPRFVLNPIRMFAGSFGGPTLWQNVSYISPNEARRLIKIKQAKQRANRENASEQAHQRHSQTKGTLRDEIEERTFDIKS
jgi:ribosome biogenesis protein BRX1